MGLLDPTVFLTSGAIGAAIEVTVANIASPTELNSRAAAQGDIILARTTEAGTGTQTWYYADTTTDVEALPYIVSSATAGVKFIAFGGRYQNENINTAALTASRVVTTDASKNLDTPATVTTTQAWAFSSTLTVVDGNFSITGSSDATKTIKFEVDAQTAADDLTINSGAQTDDRTATFPVLTGNSILALSNATLTTTRVPFATTNGILTDSADFTYSATALALGTAGVALGGATASSGQLSFYTNSNSAFFGNFGNPPGDVVGFSIPGFIGYKFNTVTLAHGFDNGVVNIADTSINALTVGGTVNCAASSTTRASIKLPHGSAPSSPVNGDMWTTTAGLFVRINGATVGPLS